MFSKKYIPFAAAPVALLLVLLAVWGSKEGFCAREGDSCAAYSPNCKEGILYAGVVKESVNWEKVAGEDITDTNRYQCSYVCKITGDCKGLSSEVLVVSQVNRSEPKIVKK
jgi:hypothetical protein